MTYPATSSNEISSEYYYHLVEQINNGTCSLKVAKVLRGNGNYTYFTYHLISFNSN